MQVIGGGTPNGDGSFTYPTDTGETVTLRGDAAERANRMASGAPEPAAPPTLDPSIVAAAAPGPDRRLAMNDAAPPAEEANAFDVTDAGPSAGGQFLSKVGRGLKSAVKAVVQAGPTPAERNAALAAPRDIGSLDEPPATGGGPKGAVFIDRAAPPAGGAPPGPTGPALNPNQLVKLSEATRTDVTRTNPYNKTELAAQEEAKKNTLAAAQAEADAKSAKAGQEADLRATTIADLQQSQARQNEIESQRRDEMDRRMARLDQLSKDAAAEKIDPNHFWGDKDTSYKIQSALMQGLSAFAATRSGGPAYAVNMVKDNIERDIAAQTANLKNKRDTIAGETNLLGQMRQEYGDRAAAETATRLAMLGVAKERLEEIGARNMPAEQKAQFDKLKASTEKEYMDAAQKLDRQTISSSTNVQYAPAGMLGGGGAPVDKETEAQAGKYGEAVEKAGLNEVDASLANVDKVLKENLGKSEIPGIGPENFLTRGYKATADAVGGTGTGAKHIYNPKERANQQTLEFVKADLRHALTGAGMSDTERASLDNMITSASNYSDIANTVRILRNKSAAHRQGLAGGFRPEAVQLYNQRRGAAAAPSEGPRVTIKPAGEP